MTAAAVAHLATLEAHVPGSEKGSPSDREISVVRSLWDAFERRAWSQARALFHIDATLAWPVSKELIAGAAGIIRVQEIYPEGWTIVPLRFAKLTDGQVLSIVRVDHPPSSFFAISFFTILNGRIMGVEEFWSTAEEPPSWRTPQVIPGYKRE